MREKSNAGRSEKRPCQIFTGKDICKIIPNFYPERTLKNLARNDFPKELVQYLQQIKEFFDD